MDHTLEKATKPYGDQFTYAIYPRKYEFLEYIDDFCSDWQLEIPTGTVTRRDHLSIQNIHNCTDTDKGLKIGGWKVRTSWEPDTTDDITQGDLADSANNSSKYVTKEEFWKPSFVYPKIKIEEQSPTLVQREQFQLADVDFEKFLDTNPEDNLRPDPIKDDPPAPNIPHSTGEVVDSKLEEGSLDSSEASISEPPLENSG